MAKRKKPTKIQRPPLTCKQEKFCLEYVKCGNGAEAYRKSYNTKAASNVVWTEVSRLLANPMVSLLIAELRIKLKQKMLVTAETQTARLHSLYEQANAKDELPSAIRALRDMSELNGLLEDPGMTINNTTNNTQINIASDAELARKIAFLLAKVALTQPQESKP